MKPIVLDCEGCRRNYILGQDALVQTTPEVLSQFAFGGLSEAAMRQQFTTPNPEDPDLIDPIENYGMKCLFRAYAAKDRQTGLSLMDEMSLEEKQHLLEVCKSQNRQIEFVRTALRFAGARWWKCEKCGQIQRYPPRKRNWCVALFAKLGRSASLPTEGTKAESPIAAEAPSVQIMWCNCPYCNARVGLPPTSEGRAEIRCTKCYKTFTVEIE